MKLIYRHLISRHASRVFSITSSELLAIYPTEANCSVQEGKILARLFHPVVTVETRIPWVFSWILDLGESVSYMDERANPLRNLTLPRCRGGSQGRGLLARSRLIGGRGLSTNSRPALCFSHHPWRVSRVSNLKSRSLNAHEISVCFIEEKKIRKLCCGKCSLLLHEFCAASLFP